MWWYYNQNLIYRADYYYCDWHRLKHNHIIDHDMVEHFFIIHIVSWIIFPLICMSVWYLSTDRHRLLCLLYDLFTVTLSPSSWSDEYVQTKGKPTQKNEAKQTKVVANMDSRWKPKYALFVDKMHWSRSDNGCCRHVERLLRALEGGEGGQGSTKRGWWRSWDSESPFRSWYRQKHNHVNAQLTRHCLQINVNRWQEIELLGCERFWKLGARERWLFFHWRIFFFIGGFFSSLVDFFPPNSDQTIFFFLK